MCLFINPVGDFPLNDDWSFGRSVKHLVEDGKLVGMEFEKGRREYDENGKRLLIPTDEDPVVLPCDDVHDPAYPRGAEAELAPGGEL